MVFVTQRHFVATSLTEKASVESNVFVSLSNMQVSYLCFRNN